MFKKNVIQWVTVGSLFFAGFLVLGVFNLFALWLIILGGAWVYTMLQQEDGVLALWSFVRKIASKVGDGIGSKLKK